MSIRSSSFTAVIICVLGAASANANDWIFDDGPYTVNPETGQRIEQYQKPKAPTRIPYSKYFSKDGPHPYIPYWFYQDEMGWPGYGGYGGFGGPGAGIPSYGISTPGAYMGPMGF